MKILLVLSLLPLAAHADMDRKGNGGDAMVCRDPAGQVLRAEAWDLFEARTLRAFTYEEAKAVGTTWQEKVSWMFDRYAPFTKDDFFAKHKAEALAFDRDARFIRGADLVDIPDADSEILPRNCKIEQLIIQRRPTDVFERWFTVNADLWDHLSETDRAVMITHEILYRAEPIVDANGQRITNSVAVRKLNTALWRDYGKDFGPGAITLAFSNVNQNVAHLMWDHLGSPLELRGDDLVHNSYAYGDTFRTSLGVTSVTYRGVTRSLKLPVVNFAANLQPVNFDATLIDYRDNAFEIWGECNSHGPCESQVPFAGEGQFEGKVSFQVGFMTFTFQKVDIHMSNFDWGSLTLNTRDDSELEIEGGGWDCEGLRAKAPVTLALLSGVTPDFNLEKTRDSFFDPQNRWSCQQAMNQGKK